MTTPPVPSLTPIPSPSATPIPSTTPDLSATPTPSATATPGSVEVAVEATFDVAALAGAVLLFALVGAIIAIAIVFGLRVVARRRGYYAHFVEHCRTPLVILGSALGGYFGCQFAAEDGDAPAWTNAALHFLLIGVIAASTLLVVSLTKAVEALVVEGVRARGEPGRANRVTTQAQILRRVAKAIIIICGLVGVIMTFPAARVAMGSLLASAGILSVVMGLAAQSALGNVFAGIQLASTDAMRVGDTVVVQKDQQGVIEEITLTYVVMRTWDDRRLILPSTHFTQNPFENWSRRSAQYTGTVDLALDWRAPIEAIRARLAHVVAGTPLWDGRLASLSVLDTSTATVMLRIAVSGRNPVDVSSLRAHVREEILVWLQREAPEALPRTRIRIETAQGVSAVAQMEGAVAGAPARDDGGPDLSEPTA
ncbi:mechanosensitive ion channel domain-containing protein [Actinomyces marmotae]|uniref:mechanosensitive ion channel domain-containing protein n=1 Tax=Actinomyces marmotae TaxID=2737173 RepID=UPI001357915E|nr:mechanosensitive ion channel domain-containing protein [Actinomyces marmotae]